MDDDSLLASGDHARLLAKYEPVIVARCVARLRGALDAEDVAQDVKLRLWRELQAGKTYRVPYRVVVHKVIGWTLKEHWAYLRARLA
jgi:DNA-directed RNA polymerase specialized sigma24 family protein